MRDASSRGVKRAGVNTAPSRASAVRPRAPLPKTGEVPTVSARGHALYISGDLVGCSKCGAFSARTARTQLFWECDPKAAFSGNPQRQWKRDNFMRGIHPKGGKVPIPVPRRLLVTDDACQWLGLLSIS